MTADAMLTALHAEARAYHAQRLATGARFDKKFLRFNDTVAVGKFYSDCGSSERLDVALAGVREAVDACVIEARPSAELIGPSLSDPQYVSGRGPLSMIQPWMAQP